MPRSSSSGLFPRPFSFSPHLGGIHVGPRPSVRHSQNDEEEGEEDEDEGKERNSATAAVASAAGNLAYVMRPDEASGGMHGRERGRARKGGGCGGGDVIREEEGREGGRKKVANQIGKKKKEKGESFHDGDERPDEGKRRGSSPTYKPRSNGLHRWPVTGRTRSRARGRQA